ncbi:hypothetical protein HAX54_005370 [Datura stramonium]|uniref:Uncharacterized protein n=1 Tax=Datura stramonium TaxID=4076 RepID=A0ABS8T8K8_DATST|nr:hypothetical protein [Datura stramonium]
MRMGKLGSVMAEAATSVGRPLFVNGQGWHVSINGSLCLKKWEDIEALAAFDLWIAPRIESRGRLLSHKLSQAGGLDCGTVGTTCTVEALVGRTDDSADLVDLLTQIHGVNMELEKFHVDMVEQIQTREAE